MVARSCLVVCNLYFIGTLSNTISTTPPIVDFTASLLANLHFHHNNSKTACLLFFVVLTFHVKSKERKYLEVFDGEGFMMI